MKLHDLSLEDFADAIRCMDYDTLVVQKAALLAAHNNETRRLANIKGQIDARRSREGLYVKDQQWFFKARAAARHSGDDCQRLQRKLGVISDRMRIVRSREFENCFVRIAKEKLNGETFQEIHDTARDCMVLE